MDPDDWQALRISHRVTGENFTQIVEKPYDYYPATAVIDGREIGEVGIRKKGFFGSAISTLAFATDHGPLSTGRGRKPAEIDHFTVWAQLIQGEPGSESAQTTASPGPI